MCNDAIFSSASHSHRRRNVFAFRTSKEEMQEKRLVIYAKFTNNGHFALPPRHLLHEWIPTLPCRSAICCLNGVLFCWPLAPSIEWMDPYCCLVRSHLWDECTPTWPLLNASRGREGHVTSNETDIRLISRHSLLTTLKTRYICVQFPYESTRQGKIKTKMIPMPSIWKRESYGQIN